MKTKKKKRARRIRLAVLLLLVLAAAVRLFFRYREAAGEREAVIPFRFDQYSDNRFSLIGRGLLVVSDLSYSVFDENGVLLSERVHNYPVPLTEVCGRYAVLWSQEGNAVTVVSDKGDAVTLNCSGNVLGADVNDAGWTVCISGEDGSKGLVSAANPKGEPVFRLHMGGSYPMDAELLSDNTRAAVLSLQSEGSHVGIFDFGEEAEQTGWTDSESLFFELEALRGGNLMVLSSDRAVFLDSRCRLIGEYSFGGDSLRDYVCTGDGFVALLLDRYKSGGAAKLITLNTEGGVLAERELNEEVEGMNASGKYLSVRHSVQTVLYSSVLQECARLESASDILSSLVRADGSAIIVSGGIAGVYQP